MAMTVAAPVASFFVAFRNMREIRSSADACIGSSKPQG
jgi:hypothetical protein